MPVCVSVDAEGVVYVVDPQPAEYVGCAMVIASGADLGNSAFALTPEQGSQIGAAVLVVWAVAYAFRVCIRALSSIDEKEQS